MLGDVIRKYRKRAGLKQWQLAKRAGVKQGAISKLERNETAHPRNLDKIGKALGITESQILKEAETGSPDSGPFVADVHVTSLKVIPLQEAHKWPANSTEHKEVEKIFAAVGINWFIVTMPDEAFCTMDEKSIPPGVQLIVRPQDHASSGDIVIARMSSGENVIRFYRPVGKQKLLRAPNRDEFLPLHDDSLEIIGRVESVFLYRII